MSKPQHNGNEWLVEIIDNGKQEELDIRYILYDQTTTNKQLEELLISAARGIKLDAVRLVLALAKKTHSRLDLSRCTAWKSIQLFPGEDTCVDGDLPALFACVTNLVLPHDIARLRSVFQCLMRAKANPYQNVHLVHVQGEPIQAVTNIRGYLENIGRHPSCSGSVRQEIHDLLAEIDRFDANSIRRLPCTKEPAVHRQQVQDIYSTVDELTFEESVRTQYCEEPDNIGPQAGRTRKSGIFSRLRKKLMGSTTRNL